MSIFDEDGYNIFGDSKYGVRIFIKYHTDRDGNKYPLIHLHEIVRGVKDSYPRRHKLYKEKLEKMIADGSYYKSISFSAHQLQELIARLVELENKRTGGAMPTMPEAQEHKEVVEDRELEDDMDGLSDFANTEKPQQPSPKKAENDEDESPFG